MKRASIYTIFLLTAGVFFTELKAQEVYLGEVKIIQNRFEQRGDSVYIEMNMNLNGLPVHKNQSFILTPVVETEKASEELPSIVINGKDGKKPINGHWLSITGVLLSRSTRRSSLTNGAGKESPITWSFLTKRG